MDHMGISVTEPSSAILSLNKVILIVKTVAPKIQNKFQPKEFCVIIHKSKFQSIWNTENFNVRKTLRINCRRP